MAAGWLEKLELNFWRFFICFSSRFYESPRTALEGQGGHPVRPLRQRRQMSLLISVVALLSGMIFGLLFGPLF